MVTKAYSAPYRVPVKPVPAVIVEFGFITQSGADAKLAHLATLAAAKAFNPGDKIQDSEVKSLYGIASPPIAGTGDKSVNAMNWEGHVPREILKSAQAQKAEAIISGDVTEVKFVGDGTTSNPRRARVTVSVIVTNAVTGEVENGSIAAGYSTPPTRGGKQPDDDTMLDQAVSEAAEKNVTNILRFHMPITNILSSREKEVVLNRGESDGFVNGMELGIVQHQKVIGLLRIKKVEKNRSWATVLSATEEIKLGYDARLYFRLTHCF